MKQFVVLLVTCMFSTQCFANDFHSLYGARIYFRVHSLFPQEDNDQTLCGAETLEEADQLGYSNPRIGNPTVSQPSAAFVRTYLDCIFRAIYQSISNQMYGDGGNDIYDYDRLVIACGEIAAKEISENRILYWDRLSLDGKHALIKFWIVRIIGPSEVLDDFSLNQEDLIDEILEFAVPGRIILAEAVTKIASYLVTRSAFLEY
ncbi:MAG: hypothetical protein KDD25_01560 [Bdellovibrionales bacterium]|nr:hypothetical protein [Bdellovibrionales bacterium]